MVLSTLPELTSERSVGVGGCLALFRQREVVANFENVWEFMYTCSVYASSSLHRKALATHRYTFRCRAASNGVLVARARERTLGTVCCVSHQPFNSIKVAFAISLELEAHAHKYTQQLCQQRPNECENCFRKVMEFRPFFTRHI